MTTLTKLKIKMWLKKLEMKRNERKHLMSLVKVMDAADTLYAFDWREREFLGEDLAREIGHGCHPDGMLVKAVDGDKIGVILNGEVKVLA